MKKRILCFFMVALIALSVVLTACNKDVYVDPSTSEKYVLVTDENGKKVLSEDGELLVYATDENGKKVKDDNGEYVTEIQGFVGQIEEDGVIEDYAYYFTLPEGWEAVNDRGEFQNEETKTELTIRIVKNTYSEYIKTSEQIYTGLNSEEYLKDAEIKPETLWEEVELEGVDSKAHFLGISGEGQTIMSLFFVQSNNLYVLNMQTQSGESMNDVKDGLLEIFNAIEFKPYTYYPELVETTNNGSFIVELN